MLHGCTPARMRAAASMMLASAVLLTLTPPVFAVPQGAASPANANAPAPGAAPYWAVVTANAVNVRSGPSAQSAYAFGKLSQGDLVRVVKEEYGWARVQTAGSAFGSLWAYVPADRRVTLSADKASAQVTARTEVRAPNSDAGGSPDKSWKQIGGVDAGATLTVLGTVEGEKDTVYKVRLPETAECWINQQFLRRATDAEAAAAATTSKPATTAVAAAAPAAPAPASPATTQAPVNAPAAGAPASTTTVTAGATTTTTTTVDPALSSPAIPPLLGQPVAITTTTTTTTTEGPGNGTTVDGTAGTVTSGGTPKVTVTRDGGTVTATSVTETRRTTIGDLDARFNDVAQKPDATELREELARQYRLLADAAASQSVANYANARAKQLDMIVETDRTTTTIHRFREAANLNKDEIAKLILDLQRRADYTAIGVLNASVVYDGQKLPELYRVCDPMTSATIAYVLPNPQIPMSTMLGTLVGVKGGRDFDPALKLTVISPMAIELLTTRETPQVAKSEETRPVSEAGTVAPAQTKTEAKPETKPESKGDGTKVSSGKPAETPKPGNAAPVPPASEPAPEK